ncbi:TetR/AcrR family transcriptional regulator [Nocardia sp. NPDC059246]|uniref:TetR/AcrR family transcriptional regulator n=1 Tax=unclassified Nocardia TaxID=2637762 RepID=UPI0036A03838
MSAPPGRRSHKQRVAESSSRLMRAAVELIAERGPSETTATQIAERAGYSREMVRVRFGSKQQLVETLVALPLEDLLAADSVDGRSGWERLLGRLSELRRLHDEDPDLLFAFFAIGFDAAGGAADLRPHMKGWIERITEVLGAMVEAGVADGSIRADVDASRAARWIVRSVVGISYEWLLARDRVDFSDEIVDVVEVLTRILRSSS